MSEAHDRAGSLGFEDWRQQMPDRDEVFKHTLTMLEQTARLVRTDADIVELIHKMVATAEEEVKRRPTLLFERGSLPQGLGAGEGDIVGGQTVAERLLDILLGHLRDEKKFIVENGKSIIDLIRAAASI